MPQNPRWSIARRLQETGGRASGFDYMRLCLAIGVIAFHTTTASYGITQSLVIWNGPWITLPNFIIPMFFSLSGFLVAGSLERSPSLISFYGLRILRIVPALAVEVGLSALIFGPILTTLDLHDYFTSTVLFQYFLNIVGDIHYHLPGVFLANPDPFTVNGQLWTVPFELQCYVALGGLAVIGAVRHRYLLLGVAIFGQLLWGWQALKRGEVGYWNGPSGPVLILYFLTGVLFYLFRNEIPFNKTMAALSLLLCAALLLAAHGSFYISVPVTYLTVYLGLLNPPRNRFLLAGDFSYGLYLYGFSVQQVFASLGPWAHHWYLNFIVCLPVTFLIACFSWYLVEKRTLGLRRYLPKIEQSLLLLVCGPGLSVPPDDS
jgi:peptidoglycan/LPS O-acetylase OafA/YrhL